jgi:hypothetical protein
MSILKRETVTITLEIEVDEITADLLRTRLQEPSLAAAFRLTLGQALLSFLSRLGWASAFLGVLGGKVG